MFLKHFYLPLDASAVRSRVSAVTEDVAQLNDVQYELCYNVSLERELTEEEERKLGWLITVPGSVGLKAESCMMITDARHESVVEIGPRLNQQTPFCTNGTSIFHNAGVTCVAGVEVSHRYKLSVKRWLHEHPLEYCDQFSSETLMNLFHDPMRHVRYLAPLTTLHSPVEVKPWSEIDVLSGRSKALQDASDEQGFGFDDWDVKFYSHLFRNKLKRNPTTVECFDLAQSNSEHSRHWFFKAQMVIDGCRKPKSLFDMVMETLNHSNSNNVIAFHDNGSAIQGFKVNSLASESPGSTAALVKRPEHRHLTLTAETHNFPTGIAPFPGAATGAGGRQRDQHAIGRGSHIIAATAGYCVGNLNLQGHKLDWEDNGSWKKAVGLADPSEIAIQASNGASNYGNTFGEPLVAGFFRAGGVVLDDKERFEYLKPIMFSAGVGAINSNQCDKIALKSDTSDLLVSKIGGPAYRIGLGGGSASSQLHGKNLLTRDMNAVQRGDGEMQHKLNRVVRACIELGDDNPILSIHDQGAGGNGNVIKEIVNPAGARIYTRAFTLGDSSLTSLELWTAEYQESDAILIDPSSLEKLKGICERERCNLDVVGRLSGDGRIIVSEQELTNGEIPKVAEHENDDVSKKRLNPVDFQLSHLFDDKGRKIYEIEDIPRKLSSFSLPKDVNFERSLRQVLSHPSVASKRFLTNKVDRSVGGLVAQQQCVGPLHTPLADVAVIALSHFDTVGTATAIGEQPMKMLCDVRAGARMAVAESLTNLVFAPVTCLRDVKCSANWMWPAKLRGEGAKLYSACEAMCDVMKEFGIAIDGGKDSLSMAAKVDDELVKSPPSLVISVYAPCVDITKVVTPDLKSSNSTIIYVPFSKSKLSLGGSILAQCNKQVGDCCVDVDDPQMFVRAWEATQVLIQQQAITAGHDISDGGLITAVLEMSFAGNRGIKLNINSSEPMIEFLFSERCGIIVEAIDASHVISKYQSSNIPAVIIGKTCSNKNIQLFYNDVELMQTESVGAMRDVWESTSFALENLQCNNECVAVERRLLRLADCDVDYNLNFQLLQYETINQPEIKVAILREEGSNGDREMAAAFLSAGFKPYDVTMNDLVNGTTDLQQFRGLAFVGGFSYADVLGSAKGWASCCLFNERARNALDSFRKRSDTFSLGVCNGCQLMALLGWVGDEQETMESYEQRKCYLSHNNSGRFESRFSRVEIQPSNSMMLQGMEGSTLGVWVAHGEGKFTFTDQQILDGVMTKAPLRYIDHHGDVTETYPLNPNGSPLGIAALTSSDGRHLAMMPHPERSFKLWQFPWQPESLRSSSSSNKNGDSPWMRMFQNAYKWCTSSKE